MKVMVASKMCEPADTLKEETEFDSNMMETKPKTSYKRQMITYYTILILSLTVIACVLSTRNFAGDIKDRQEELPY